MACEILALDGAVFCVWGRPTLQDLDRVEQTLRDMSEKGGGPVVFITRVPAAAPPPEQATRQHMNERMQYIVQYCSSYHVVLEGTGFFAAMKRAVLVTLFQVGGRRKMFFVHSMPDEVLHSASPAELSSVADVLRVARAQGLLRGIPRGSLPPGPAAQATA